MDGAGKKRNGQQTARVDGFSLVGCPAPSASFPTKSAIAGILAVLAGVAAQGAHRLVSQLWYSVPILDHVYGRVGLAEFDERLARSNRSRNPGRRWRADPEILDAFVQGRAEGALAQVGKESAVALANFQARLAALGTVRSVRRRRRAYDHEDQHRFGALEDRRRLRRPLPSISVAIAIRDAIRFRLEEAKTQAAGAAVHLPEPFPSESGLPPVTILSRLDMDKSLSKEDYTAGLKRYQSQLNQLQRAAPGAADFHHSGLRGLGCRR